MFINLIGIINEIIGGFMEGWKAIDEWYDVHPTGVVRSWKSARGRRANPFVLKGHTRPDGYVSIRMYGKSYLLHRLVATAFLPNPDDLPMVNHKDENPTNCCVDNLEWCTAEYNSNYSLAKEIALKDPIDNKIIVNGLRKFCRETGIDISTLYKVLKGERTSTKGYTLWQ